MMELGNFTEPAHQHLGRAARDLSIDLLLVLGEQAPVVVESALRHGFNPQKVKVVESHSEAITLLEEMIQEGDWILVKGSRRMAMERIAERLKERRT
jgi:UDP-N-acetylmuramoyl-tripeptide--D-alanyl-D-alanine ligase